MNLEKAIEIAVKAHHGQKKDVVRLNKYLKAYRTITAALAR